MPCSFNYTIQRPSSAPGLNVDLQPPIELRASPARGDRRSLKSPRWGLEAHAHTWTSSQNAR